MEWIYKFRPGYGSKEYLIEIINAEQHDGTVLNIFLDAIKELSPKTSNANLKLMLQTDEFAMEFSTSAGNFMFNQDFWGFIFIHPLDKNADIVKIEQLLQKDIKFVKEKVDIENIGIKI